MNRSQYTTSIDAAKVAHTACQERGELSQVGEQIARIGTCQMQLVDLVGKLSDKLSSVLIPPLNAVECDNYKAPPEPQVCPLASILREKNNDLQQQLGNLEAIIRRIAL